MKIQIHKDGIVNIDCEAFTYSNIRNMYTENRNGAGIQISDELKNKLDDVNECCDAISKYIYKLQDIIEKPLLRHSSCQAPQPRLMFKPRKSWYNLIIFKIKD